jgi:hypothetical protein
LVLPLAIEWHDSQRSTNLGCIRFSKNSASSSANPLFAGHAVNTLAKISAMGTR